MTRTWETRQVSMWLANDYDEYSHWSERASELVAEDSGDRLADEISDELYDRMAEALPGGLLRDLLRGSLSEVDFDDVAGDFIDPVLEEMEA